MKKIIAFAFLAIPAMAMAQPGNIPGVNTSKYDPHNLFAPGFYESGSTVYRSADGSPGERYWQNRADYNLKATLDEQKDAIDGNAVITYRNNSPQALKFIWLQLDQNLFEKNSRGQKKINIGSTSRYGEPGNPFDGGYKFSAVKVNGAPAKYIITDTRMQVWLPQALATGQSVTIDLAYRYNLIKEGADRYGIMDSKNGKIYSVAQWYPRLCVYDDVNGWNTDPYLGAGEFYLEYGNFNVEITAPASHLVVAGGTLENAKAVLGNDEFNKYNQAMGSQSTVMIRSEKDLAATSKLTGSKTWKFTLQNSRDFSWASSKAFIWDGAQINLPGGGKSFAQSAYPSESAGANAWRRSTEFVKGSIEGYSKRWFTYPYPVAVNVACNVSGMEYPAIVFCGANAAGGELWGVTDHEFGHTWFPMIVGSNERRYGWMDEGFNTFINGISNEDFNKGEFNQEMLPKDMMAMYVSGPQTEGIYYTPDAMREANIGSALYFKPGMALGLLRKYVLGPERFDSAFRTYVSRWAYKHPTPTDFFRTMENVSGEDLSWFWRGWFKNNYRLDQAIVSVNYNEKYKGSVVTLSNNQEMAMPVVLTYETVSGKKGTMVLPAEVWNNNTKITTLIDVPEKLKSVNIDADKEMPDMNVANNSWKAQ